MFSVIASVGSTALVSISQSQSAAVAFDERTEVHATRQAKAPVPVVQHVIAVWSRLTAWKMRRATRIVLSSLDDRTLKDIGLPRSEIDAVLHDVHTRTQRWPL